MGSRADALGVSGMADRDRPAASRQGQEGTDQGCRQLKVEDALAYLEQVKQQFTSHPDVYNQFLDIMKEFKAQSIDTAEVIRRVSTLFEGRRSLILGFNTFLPPGYRIELRGDPTTGCVTGFSSPGGVFCALREEGPQRQTELQPAPPPPPPPLPIDASTQHAVAHQDERGHSAHGGPMHGQSRMRRPDGMYERGGAYRDPMHETDEKLPPGNIGPSLAASRQHSVAGEGSGGAAAPGSATNDNAAAALAGGLGSPGTGDAASGKPIEFAQAVTYVNKIKSRFAEEEHMYKTFLDILQTYQKEQKTTKDVYKQVSELFRDHSDLLGEFSHFLPEQPNQRGSGLKLTTETVRFKSQESPVIKEQPTLEGVIQEQQPPGSYSATNWKEKEKTTKGVSRSKSGKSASSAGAAATGLSKHTASAPRRGSSALETSRKGRRNSSSKKLADVKATGTGDLSASGSGLLSKSSCPPELEFFEELRNLLGDGGQQSYSEFIKCLSLFSQEIICGDELMRLADGLLNHRKPLTEAFRAFLNQEDPKATQTAVTILRRARNAGDAVAASFGSKAPPVAPIASSSAVRDRLRDLPALAGIHVDGHRHTSTSGIKSPKINPLYKGRPLSEIGREHGTEISDSKSYISLPSDLGTIHSSGMTPDDRKVLNHTYVTRPREGPHSLLGSIAAKREYQYTLTSDHRLGGGKSVPPASTAIPSSPGAPSSPRTVRNGFSKAAFAGVEDQRVDLNLLISRAENTVSKLERLMKGEIRNISSLSAVDVQPVELIYRDSSIDIIEVLRSTPGVTAPVILVRLKQRLTDWKASQKRVEQVWKAKRFSSEGPGGGPRTWHRSELVGELIQNSSSSQAHHGVRNGGSEAPINRTRSPKILRSSVVCDLVCNPENIDYTCDLLWFMFEWEADSFQQAEKALDTVEQVYEKVQYAKSSGEVLYADEYLYVYIRLLAETSQRVGYILEHNYDGVVVDSMMHKLQEVLSGNMSLTAYDKHCKQLFGEGRRWETLLADFPVILKRLCAAALKMPSRKIASELLHLAGDSPLNENGAPDDVNDAPMEIDTDGGEVKNVTRTPMNGEKATLESRAKRLRKALVITSSKGHDLFEVKVSKEHVATNGELVEARQSKKPGELGLVVVFRHLPKETAAQFTHFDLDEKIVAGSLVSTRLMGQINRAKKKERKWRCRKRTADNVMKGVMQEDGLDVRIDNEDGHLHFVSGTEDFFMRKRRKRSSWDGGKRMPIVG